MIELDVFKRRLEEDKEHLPLLTLDEFFDGNPEEDSINIYVLQSTRYVYREKLGRITEHNFIIE